MAATTIMQQLLLPEVLLHIVSSFSVRQLALAASIPTDFALAAASAPQRLLDDERALIRGGSD